MNGCWSWKAGSVGGGSASEGTQLEDTGSYLAHSGLCLLHPPPPRRSPLFIILTGNKIYGLSIVSEPAAAFQPPLPPSLCRALPVPLGLGKNKESLQGREWVGTAHREDTEPQM